MDAKLGLDEPDLGGAKGDQLPNSPNWSGSLSFDYGFEMGGTPSFFRGSWRYVGEIPVGFDGVDIGGVNFPAASPRFFMDSYSILDLNVGFITERFDISLYATNLLDEYAYTNFGTSFNAPGSAIVLRPRTFGIVLKAKFD